MTYKKDFPIFENNPELIYLDSAATSQRPKVVIEALKNFLEKTNANTHRGLYTLSEKATEDFEKAREKVANFINAEKNETVFTKNATEAFNLLANTLPEILEKGKNEIVLTEMEHHSNIVPWQVIAKKLNLKIKFIPVKENYELDYEEAEKIINENTGIVSIIHTSNVLGTTNNIGKIIELAKKQKAFTIIDATQSIQHQKLDVKTLDTDFLVFSGHKTFGPTGIGGLYGKYGILKNLSPHQTGGGMIKTVTKEESTFENPPIKFEAGTQNIAEAISLGSAIDYINELTFQKIKETEEELFNYAMEKLSEIKDIEIYSNKKPSSIISFNLKNIHCHDVASLLNDDNIAIRAGHHCCMPLMEKLKLDGVCRISFSIFNTKEDVDKLTESLKKIQEKFKK